MVDLGSTMKGIGTDTDSRIKLKSSLGSRVGVGSWVGPNHIIQVHIHFPTIDMTIQYSWFMFKLYGDRNQCWLLNWVQIG